MAQKRDLGVGVRVLTVHKAQGREFKAVAIAAMNDGQFPDFRATSPDAIQAERQTFYVAATRASRTLLLTRAETRPTHYGARPTEPSPYLQLVKQARTSPSSIPQA
ncbi:MAG: ATP-binding domain-containing protein [Acidimicrobiaceae bacterium]|nr:ATP-binding domain-containing protein [Acidimicrobiia bacterium]MCY4494223.1 ATP-binding domain-containing protein [Acidimicrobiaceae bacterium]